MPITSIVESLTPTIDGLRAALYPLAGIRQFEMAFVTRTWSGDVVGEGAYSDAVVIAATQCKVDAWDLKIEAQPCGEVETGSVKLSEVSLQYTYPVVTGGDLAENQQFFVRLTEAHLHQQPPRYFVHGVVPLNDLEKGFGWIFDLRRVNVPDGAA